MKLASIPITIERVQDYFINDGRECDGCPFSRETQEYEGGLTECLVIEGAFNCKPDDCPGVYEETQ